MFYKVKSCSLLHHMKLQHLSLMLFSFISIKESPKATTIYPTFTWEVPRAFELLFVFLEGKSTSHTSMSSTPGKAWIFRGFCTSYCRGLCLGIGSAGARARGSSGWRQRSSCHRWAALPCMHCCSLKEARCPKPMSTAIVAAWCRGCSEEVKQILLFFCELISLFLCLNNGEQLTLSLHLCK